MATLETDAVPEPNFRALILKIASNLGTHDLDALKYLFKDLLPQNRMTDAVSMFTLLEEKRLIQQGKTSLLTHAFLRIGRNDLLQLLQGADQEDMARDQERGFPAGTVSDFRLDLFGIAENLAPDEVENAKYYFGDIIGKQKRGKIKNAFDLLNILEQLIPDNIIDKLESFLTQIERNDILQDLLGYKGAGASKKPRRSVQEVRQNSGHASGAPKSEGAAPPGSDGKNATRKDLFPGSLGKANQGIDVEKAGDMHLINQAAASVCSIGTNGTGFRVGERCIMTAAHVLKEALGIPEGELQKILDMDCDKRSSYFKRYVQHKLDSTGLCAFFTHGRTVPDCYKLTSLRYVDIYLDTAVVELESDGKPFPESFTPFNRDYKGTFNLIGHVGDLTLYREHNCYTITDWQEFQRMKRELWKKGILPEHLEVYDSFGKDSSFLQFHCSFTQGASGSPGVVVKDGEVYVVTMLRAGYPQNPHNIPLDPTLCVEVGVTMTAIRENLKSTDETLHKDIFPQDFHMDWN